MSDVQVTFGAKIDDLVRGINDVKAQLDQLKGKFEEVKQHTESISSGIGTLTSGLKAFASSVAGAFTVEGIASFIGRMADLGQRTESLAAVLGLPAAAVVNLGGIAKLTGTSIDALSSGIERMNVNILRSTHDSTNPAAIALKNLGLSAKDFLNIPADQWFSKLSGAISKFESGMNLTANLMVLAGRSAVGMLPALLQGEKAFREFQAAVTQAQNGLSAAIPGMAETDSKIKLLGLSVESLSARIFTGFKSSFDGLIELFTELSQKFNTAISEGGNTAAMFDVIRVAVAGLASALVIVIAALQTLFNLLANGLSNSIGLVKEFVNVGIKTLTFDTAGADAATQRFKDHFHAMAVDIVKDMETTVKSMNSTLKSIWSGFLQESQSGMDQEFNVFGKKKPVKPPGFVSGGEDALAEAQRKIGLIEQDYQMAAEKINHSYKMTVDFFGAAEAQKTQALLAAINERMSAELAVLDTVQQKYAAGSKEFERIEDEKKKILAKSANDRLKIENQAAEAAWQRWKSASDQIAGTFSSGISSMVTGGKTFGQAMAQITRGIIDSFISMVTKMAFEWIAKQLFMATATKAVQATEVAGTVAVESAKTAAVTAGVATRTGAEAAGASANIFSQIGQAISFIFTQAAKVFAGVFAFLSPVMGPAAAGPATASSSEVIAVAGGLGAFDKGTDFVHKSGMAIIHRGEQIVPAEARPGYTGANAGGRSGEIHNHFHINAVDPQSFAAFLKRGGAEVVARHIAPVMNRNPGLRPKY